MPKVEQLLYELEALIDKIENVHRPVNEEELDELFLRINRIEEAAYVLLPSRKKSKKTRCPHCNKPIKVKLQK